jgi:hypothetical protein
MRSTPLVVLILVQLLSSLSLSSQESSSAATQPGQPTQATQPTPTPAWSGGLQSQIDREDVADKIFPRLAVTSEGPSSLSHVILRFSDPDSEIVITTLQDGSRIVESYVLDPGTTIGSTISQVLQRNPQASLDQLASAVRVHKTTISVPQRHVERWLQQMNGILPAKIPTAQIHLDEVPQFDLWMDANGDFIHYRFFEVPEQPHDDLFAPLARWMVKLNSEVADFRRKGRR